MFLIYRHVFQELHKIVRDMPAEMHVCIDLKGVAVPPASYSREHTGIGTMDCYSLRITPQKEVYIWIDANHPSDDAAQVQIDKQQITTPCAHCMSFGVATEMDHLGARGGFDQYECPTCGYEHEATA